MKPLKRIVIGCDHRGFALKEYLKTLPLASWDDVGAFTAERSDYPVFAQQAITKMHQEPAIEGAVLLCGSGNGMAIAANRFKGMYACVAWNKDVARQSKEDDRCNVLVIPADYVSHDDISDIVSSWLNADFKEGRYAERLLLIDSFV